MAPTVITQITKTKFKTEDGRTGARPFAVWREATLGFGMFDVMYSTRPRLCLPKATARL